MNLKDYIREIPDYPKRGVSFKDISPLVSNIKAFKFCLDKMSYFVDSSDKEIEYFASIDARGFIFGSVLSDRHSIPNVLIRKKGKLPPWLPKRQFADLQNGCYVQSGATTRIKKNLNFSR